MKLFKAISLATVIGFATSPLFAQDAATVEEVQAKVKEAAEAIAAVAADKGKLEALLKEIQKKDAKWAWKDTYVFVYDCKANKGVAHATLKDKPIKGLKDKAGNLIFGGDAGLCKAAEQPNGGWVAYMWPKKEGAEPSNKVSFGMTVKGTDYQVGAGVYADKKVEKFELK